ncbi:hypothetical protein QBC32DRAFT_21418 [Pseudoneurospora amorphoporcata]|uniref:Uncharacterized protein n=1 Tax=Pseudoneurospora amorphoporcata TaxID=241081 RepID=A0AAN6NSD1_9PEZI|nr:hypothetical protein QBC32DRAFT_21418 [Pseudoneurospora amorphoporcata]
MPAQTSKSQWVSLLCPVILDAIKHQQESISRSKTPQQRKSVLTVPSVPISIFAHLASPYLTDLTVPDLPVPRSSLPRRVRVRVTLRRVRVHFPNSACFVASYLPYHFRDFFLQTYSAFPAATIQTLQHKKDLTLLGNGARQVDDHVLAKIGDPQSVRDMTQVSTNKFMANSVSSFRCCITQSGCGPRAVFSQTVVFPILPSPFDQPTRFVKRKIPAHPDGTPVSRRSVAVIRLLSKHFGPRTRLHCDKHLSHSLPCSHCLRVSDSFQDVQGLPALR